METQRRMRVKKWIFSFLLTVLLFGAVPLSVEAAENDDALVAYNDLVQSIISQYGYANGYFTDTFPDAYGLADAVLLDFDGDGTQELVMVWGTGGFSRVAIYTFSNGGIQVLWENEPYIFPSLFNAFIDRVGNATYLGYGEARHFYYPVLVCKDGVYVKPSEWTDEDYERINEAGQYGLWGEGQMRFIVALEKYGVFLNGDFLYGDAYRDREELWSFATDGTYFVVKPELADTLATLNNAALSRLSFEETKERLPYTGVSRMNLSPEQAQAFAEVLKSYSYPIQRLPFLTEEMEFRLCGLPSTRTASRYPASM
jgi:hypothetical protein